MLLTLLLVVMVALATAFCRRWGKEQVYKDHNANRGVRFQVTNTLNSTAYYELMSLDMDHDSPSTPLPSHFTHEHYIRQCSLHNWPSYQPID